MSTGSDLETAIMAAAKHYQALDKCELAKQHTPRRHDGGYSSKAPVDFKGWYRDDRINHDGGRNPLYIEAKATSDGLVKFVPKDGDGIKENQLEAMRDAMARNIQMLLVIDFVREGEVIVVNASHVVEFADAPWRKSLSLHWARAFGRVAKVSADANGKHRCVWFLDVAEHPEWAVAGIAVSAEKAKAAGVVVDLFPVELKPSINRAKRFAERPRPGTPEHKEYLIECANAGMKRQMGTRKPMFGKPRAKQGWNPR